MLTLRADNRILVSAAKFTYLTQNYNSGVGTLNVTNTGDLSVNDPILIGEIGNSNAKIFKVASVNTTTGDITLNDIDDAAATTTSAYPESTKVTLMPYNQIRFFHTVLLGTIADETPTFNDLTPLTIFLELDPTSYYSVYEDSDNTTGFGWFKYKNSQTTEVSQESNPIPYAGFKNNTVLAIFDDFDALLNVHELKLVTLEDKFSWFNEGLSLLKNKLNLNNVEYTLSEEQTINVLSGTSEYQLPDDFSDLVEITDGDNLPVPNVSASKILTYTGENRSVVKYYIRGRFIGFVPEPTTASTVKFRYRAKAVKATSLSTYVNLPDNMFYAVKDWMMYRANLKFSNPLAASYLISFNMLMDLYIQASVKRTAHLDTFGITPTANV